MDLKALIISVISLLSLLVSLTGAADTGHEKPNSYAVGFGSYKMGSPDVGFFPLDYSYRGDFVRLQTVLGYGLDRSGADTDHMLAFIMPLSFELGRKEPVRIGFGFDFRNYLYVSGSYAGTHTIGPSLSLAYDIPFNGSSNEIGWSLGFGVITDEYDVVYITDMTFRDNLQIYFSERTGINVSVNIASNLTGFESALVTDRALIYVGPCFRW